MKTQLLSSIQTIATACASIALAIVPASAASSTAPVINDADIANYGDVSGTDKWFVDVKVTLD